MLLACTILVVGLALSVGAALLWRAGVRSREHQQFETNATSVAQTAETLLSRDADLVTTLRGVMTMQPNISATRFDQWFAQLESKQRQVGGLGTTIVEVVPARELAAFQARRAADPAFRRFVRGTTATVPPSGRPNYCLLSAGGIRHALHQGNRKAGAGRLVRPHHADRRLLRRRHHTGRPDSADHRQRPVLGLPRSGSGSQHTVHRSRLLQPRRSPEDRRPAPRSGRRVGWQLV